jgi:hypothetical protein
MADTSLEQILADLRTWGEQKIESLRLVMVDLTRTEEERDAARRERDALAADLTATKKALADCLGQPNPDPDPDPIPDPLPIGTALWEDIEVVRQTPQNTAEYNHIVDRAESKWDPIGFYLNAQGGTQMMAGMIVYIITGSTAMLTKVLNQLHRMLDTPDDARLQTSDGEKPFFTRTLELGRYLQSSIFVADWLNILGVQWRRDEFRDFVFEMVTKALPGHSGFNSILASATSQWNNWSGMARSSVVAACLFLLKYGTAAQKAQAEIWLAAVIRMYKSYVGEPVDLGFELIPDKHWDFTGWYADGKAKKEPKAGINPRGEKITLIGPDNVTRPYNVSGVNIMDRLRAEIWPTRWMGEHMGTGYDSEGGQAFVSTLWQLWRAGLMSPEAGDHALERWNDWLHGMGEAASNIPVYAPGHTGDDNWINRLVNIMLRKNKYPVKEDKTPGKGTGFSIISSSREVA